MVDSEAPIGTDIVPVVSKLTKQRLIGHNYRDWNKKVRV